MGFLEATVDLKGTKFKPEALGAAQEFLTRVISRYDPQWLKKPCGPLGKYWNRADVESICFLINFADILGVLQNNVTQKSVRILEGKLKKLLRAKGGREFESTLLELQFARALCERVSPIAFEPFVPGVLNDRGKQPPSEDFAIRLPEGDLVIEVTTLYFGALNKWERATKLLARRLHPLLQKRRVSCTVRITFPLEFDSISILSQKDIVDLVSEISKSESGKTMLSIRKKEGIVEWRPISASEIASLLSRTKARIPGTPVVLQALVFQKQILPEDHNEVFLKSLRNTLNRKRDQQRGYHPYLLVLRLGHYSITVGGVMAAIRERIWPNKDYQWLTGLLIFTPASSFRVNDPPPTLNYSFNPNPRIAAPRGLLDLLENQKRFHLRGGEFYQE